ncbi:MAG: DUF1559 domain-containing protein [Verrucomicrobiota bacterium]
MWHKRINLAVALFMGLLVAIVLFPWIQQQRAAARKMQTKLNMKQIGLALHNYESTYKMYPPGGVFDLEGQGFHGWMTSILPFVDASSLYRLIDFDEPWNSKQNAGLFLHGKSCYENRSDEEFREPIVKARWEFPVAHFSANSNIMAANSSVRLESIDNSEQVFAAGELVGGFVPWGCPYNWREFNGLSSTPPTFGCSTRDGCHFLFVGGRVEFISRSISTDVLKRMNGEDHTGFKANSLKIQLLRHSLVHPTHFGLRGVPMMIERL